MNNKKVYFIGTRFDSKNGWALYSDQVKKIFGKVVNLIDVEICLDTITGNRKVLLRLLFQLIFLPSLWIDTLINNREIFKKIELIKNPEIIVLDHFQYWWLVFPIRKRFPDTKIVLVSHNLEFKNKLSYVKYAPILYKIFAIFEFPIVLFWEYLTAKQVYLITSINSIEQQFFKSNFLRKKTLLIYPIFKKKLSNNYNSDNLNPIKKMILVGSYSYKAKILNAIWIAKIFNSLSYNFPNLVLDIIGRGIPDNLMSYTNTFKNVQIIGEVEELSSVYEEAFAVIIPERLGGGFKLKILEAISFYKPMIIHEEALKGTGLTENEECLSFKDKRSLKECLQILINDPVKYNRLIDNSYKKAEELYCQPDITEQLHKILYT